VINQTMARKFFGEDNPIGRRFGFGGPEDAGKIEVVGIVRDAKYTSLRGETPPTAYTPYLQETPGQMNFAVRAAADVVVWFRQFATRCETWTAICRCSISRPSGSGRTNPSRRNDY